MSSRIERLTIEIMSDGLGKPIVMISDSYWDENEKYQLGHVEVRFYADEVTIKDLRK